VPDECAYYKEDAGKMMLGAFEPVAKPWGMAGIPEDFASTSCPRISTISSRSWKGDEPDADPREAGIHTFFNGPESFTPDDRYYLGEAPELGATGSPPATTRSASSRRAGPAWRSPTG
jgi:hypothetical protein